MSKRLAFCSDFPEVPRERFEIKGVIGKGARRLYCTRSIVSRADRHVQRGVSRVRQAEAAGCCSQTVRASASSGVRSNVCHSIVETSDARRRVRNEVACLLGTAEHQMHHVVQLLEILQHEDHITLASAAQSIPGITCFLSGAAVRSPSALQGQRDMIAALFR